MNSSFSYDGNNHIHKGDNKFDFQHDNQQQNPYRRKNLDYIFVVDSIVFQTELHEVEMISPNVPNKIYD